SQPLAGSRSDGHYVFHCTSEFYAQHVVVGVQAEGRAGKFFLQKGGERRIVRSQRYGGWFAARGFRSKRGAGKYRDAPRWLRDVRFCENLREDQTHAQVRFGFE